MNSDRETLIELLLAGELSDAQRVQLSELAAADAAKADTGGGSDDSASGDAEIQAANHQLRAENTAMKADLMALREWADSMGGRLTTLSQSLGALAPASADD